MDLARLSIRGEDLAWHYGEWTKRTTRNRQHMSDTQLCQISLDQLRKCALKAGLAH